MDPITEIFSDSSTQRVINDRYKVLSVLGQGGQGAVYKVADTHQNDKILALKVVAWGDKGDESNETLERVTREYSVLKKLSHPNIVEVYESGRLGSHSCFIAMEFVNGQNLDQRIKDSKNPLSFQEIVKILRDVAVGLESAHNAQVLHRDLKPANILLPDQGGVKILDFGLARDMEVGYTITQSGDTIGTPYYMSPEQFRRTEALDHRTDIYAFGIVAYEMVVGEPPFKDGAYIDIARAHLTRPVPKCANSENGVPEWFSNFVGVCVQKKPSDRLQSMGEVTNLLERRMKKMGLIEGPAESTNSVKRFFLRMIGEE